ncbi:MAG: type II toxin-antitoxin system VapC family toxin [Verrucomicrobia bacterium]|nr:type II toxin-antitoxin system VapC family toxin [Verrucomicrobiota bacterium]
MLLLDSNIWFKHYWRLPMPEQMQRRMETEELAFSPVSALEIATKIRKGHFPGIPPIEQWLAAAVDGYLIAPVTPEIAAAAGADKRGHQDPADRMLVHTALAHRFTFIHSGSMIRKRTDLQQAYFKLAAQN